MFCEEGTLLPPADLRPVCQSGGETVEDREEAKTPGLGGGQSPRTATATATITPPLGTGSQDSSSQTPGVLAGQM